MSYNEWSLKLKLLARNEWYDWNQLVHYVRNDLAQKPFVDIVRDYRTVLTLSTPLRRITTPFSRTTRFPIDSILINTSFKVDSCFCEMRTAVASTGSTMFVGSSLNKLYEILNQASQIPEQTGVFDRDSFEKYFKLKWMVQEPHHCEDSDSFDSDSDIYQDYLYDI